MWPTTWRSRLGVAAVLLDAEVDDRGDAAHDRRVAVGG